MLKNFLKLFKRSMYLSVEQSSNSRVLTPHQIVRFPVRNLNSENVHDEKEEEIEYPNYKERFGESEEEVRKRLLYQSRKRGTLEVGLLLSTFASVHLSSMTLEQLTEYDKLINRPHNEWDIYYWLTGAKPIPEEFQSPIMDLLIEFSKNKEKEVRITQPSLYKE